MKNLYVNKGGPTCVGCAYDYNHCELAYDWCCCKTCNDKADLEPP